MIVLDRLLIGGIRFVLDKVVSAVDAELNDEQRIREDLLAAQMRHELGEIDENELAAIEHDHSESFTRSSLRRMLTKLYGGQGPVNLNVSASYLAPIFFTRA